MLVCRQCGKELPQNYTTDICLECARANVKNLFNENPEVKQAFKESIEEMKKPENIKKMVDDTVKFMRVLWTIQKKEE